ncbi:MAG: glycerol-3-phosphate transporter permease, partial [Paracoccaceae bacterium]|nr:glycerol-3-phosphate transporter permease [Paracoccaceae bacterium]
MEKRVIFKGWMLPALLLLPQIVITAIFFFYPAGQAIWQSMLVQDAFGLSVRFVWFENFTYLLDNREYLNAIRVTALFSLGVTVLGLGVALLLAAVADHVIKGALAYRTLLIWPYAVAP